MNAGTHAGEPSEKRVDQRMTGRNQPGVGMGRKLGLAMGALSEAAIPGVFGELHACPI